MSNIISIPPVAGFKNLLINPGFTIPQRGTSFSATGYTFDKWLSSIGTGGSPAATMDRVAFTLGQTAVPYNPKYYYRHVQSAQATSTGAYIAQRVESVVITGGRTVTFSCWLACSSGTLSVIPYITQIFGTGGAPSGNVVTAGNTWTISTTWTRYKAVISVPSISGKTLGTDNNDCAQALVYFPLNSTYTIYMANPQLEVGSAATEPELRSFSQEMELAQRYYEKSYSLTDDPGTVTNDGADLFFVSGVSITGGGKGTRFSVTKRGTPVVTMYSPVTGTAARVRDTINNADKTVTTTEGHTGFWWYATVSSGALDLSAHWTATADL